jgi:ABC-type branched-subunit amino acid transport system substrate-binding protein
LLAILSTVVLAACGSSSSSSSSSSGGSSSGSTGAASAGAPLVIGLIPPAGGALAVFGQDEVKAWQFAADEVNASGGVAGHMVKLVTEQTDVTPPATLRAARKAVTQDNAHFIGAVISSPETAALNPQLTALGALDFNSTAKDNILSGAQCSANTFNIVQSAQMDVNAVGKSLGKLPAKKWAIIAEDYSTGHDEATGFADAVKKAGGSVVKTVFAPLGTTDFGSFISQLSSSGADGVFTAEFGADGVAFVNQGAQFGLFKKIPTTVGFNTVSEPLFPVLGPKVLGFYNNVGYAHQQNFPLNTTFAAAWKAKYGSFPYYVEADNYLAAQTLFQGVRKAGSVDPEKVKAALNGLSFDSITGQVTMRAADHQLLRPSNLGQVVKLAGGPGGLGWKIISTVPASETTPSANPACHI